jgi:hypothetical protein
MANTPNPFQRYAYSSRYKTTDQADANFNSSNNLVVFSGGDLQAYFNNIKVGNLESVTWSISVEVVGNYVMGQRDAVTYTTGKRVIVGSIVLSQYDRHALLEQVFNLSANKYTSIGSLWNKQLDVAGALNVPGNATFIGPAGLGANNPTIDQNSNATNVSIATSPLSRGLGATDFNTQLQQQLQETARLIGSQKFNYSDQIPPFDLTLVGVTRSGIAARCSIFGMQITQETAGFSQNDLGNSVGMSFVSLGVSPWRQIDLDGSNLVMPVGN